MFLTADWTHPQTGGLLSEVIEKEERQLREPKPRVPVHHVWDPDTLKDRATLWKQVPPRPQPANALELARSKLGMSVPEVDASGELRHSRSKMFASRRNRDALAAMARERDADAQSSEAGFKSAASLFTPEDLQKLRPIYAPNEKCATETTNQLFGLGAARVPLGKSRYARMKPFPPDSIICRNNPDRSLVESLRHETRTRARPWVTPPAPPLPPIAAPHIVPRSQTSSFCIRPGDIPVE